MNIAICDEKTADRKHLERLLGRESDMIKDESGNLLVDSFGSSTIFLTTASIYNLFFIDMTDSENASLALAAVLREKGIAAPIVFFTTTVTAENCPKELSNIYFMEKPLSPSRLSEIISIARDFIKSLKPVYDIRSTEATFYISGEDFLYAKSDSYRHCLVYLANGNILESDGFLETVAVTMKSHSSVFMLNKKYLLNASYIKDFSNFSLTLITGEKLPLRRKEAKELKLALANRGYHI